AVADADAVALDRDLAGEAAVHRIVAQQMRVGLHRRQIVDGDDFDIVAVGLDDGAQNIAADAVETVDGNADGHIFRSRSSPPPYPPRMRGGKGGGSGTLSCNHASTTFLIEPMPPAPPFRALIRS